MSRINENCGFIFDFDFAFPLQTWKERTFFLPSFIL